MDLSAIQVFVSTTLIDVALKVLAAIAFWIVGRWLIQRVIHVIQAAMARGVGGRPCGPPPNPAAQTRSSLSATNSSSASASASGVSRTSRFASTAPLGAVTAACPTTPDLSTTLDDSIRRQ